MSKLRIPVLIAVGVGLIAFLSLRDRSVEEQETASEQTALDDGVVRASSPGARKLDPERGRAKRRTEFDQLLDYLESPIYDPQDREEVARLATEIVEFFDEPDRVMQFLKLTGGRSTYTKLWSEIELVLIERLKDESTREPLLSSIKDIVVKHNQDRMAGAVFYSAIPKYLRWLSS